MTMKTKNQNTGAGVRAFMHWLAQSGVSRSTGWRWRHRGWIKTVNVGGRVFVTEDEIWRFTERVRAGEFAKDMNVPQLYQQGRPR